MRKVYKSLMFVLALLASFSLSTTPAFAGIFDGGGGSIVGPTGNRDNIYWVASNSIDDYLYHKPINWGVWPVFRDSNYDNTGPEGVRRAIYNSQPECSGPNVRAVFAQQIDGGTWKEFRISVDAANTAGGTYGDLLNAYHAQGGNDDSVNRQLGAIASRPVPIKAVICVTQDTITKWDEDASYSPQQDTRSVTCVYSKAITVARQISARKADGTLYDPIGADNLENQPAQVSLTPFGEALNNYVANPSEDIDDVMNRIASACDESSESPKVDLSQKNQEGLGEGGILNVSVYSRMATFTASQSSQKYVGCISWESISYDNGATWRRTGNTRPCGSDYPTEKDVSPVNTTSSINQSQVQTNFWQILSVHCNQDGFNNLAQATSNGTVVNSGDPSKAISAVMYSPKYKQKPQYLDFGDSSNPNAAKAATGALGFYDKECPFECTNSKDANDGATPDNGAVFNNINTAPDGGTVKKYGAVSDKLNSNSFEFFRDNIAHSITLDVWYPKSAGVVKYNGTAPLTTVFTRWNGGTPTLDGSSGGTFTAKTMDGRNIFSTTGSVKNQKNWDPNAQSTPDQYEYSSPNAALFKGLIRAFTVQASWASDPNKPQVLNVKWEYAPIVGSNIAIRGIGFDVNGNPVYSEGQVSAPIQGKCYANFGTNNGVNSSIPDTQKNTGTGTTNNLDNHLVQGEPAPGTKPQDNQTNLFINFVRSTSE